MSSEFVVEKQALRQKMRAVLKAMAESHRSEFSSRACALLRQQSVWKTAQAVLFYNPLKMEIDLSSLMSEGLSAGKMIALPRFIDEAGVYDSFQIRDIARDCAPGKFGISEPAARCPYFPRKRLDLVLAPGVAFDSTGHRLGRGQGFYDRLLADIIGIKCGVAFDEQVVERVPAEGHDARMNFILTPTRWLKVS